MIRGPFPERRWALRVVVADALGALCLGLPARRRTVGVPGRGSWDGMITMAEFWERRLGERMRDEPRGDGECEGSSE